MKTYETNKPQVKIERGAGTSTTVRIPQPQYETRQQRMQQQFGQTYYPSTPGMMVYHDSFNPWFWMWLMNQNNDSQAEWAYNHREEMDQQRYQDMLTKNSELAAKVMALETAGKEKNPNYVPSGVDQDLIYSDTAVQPQENAGMGGVTIIFILIAMGGVLILVIYMLKRD